MAIIEEDRIIELTSQDRQNEITPDRIVPLGAEQVSHEWDKGTRKGFLQDFPVGATVGMAVAVPFTGGMSLLSGAGLVGLGAAGGEAYEQIYKQFAGEETPSILRPAPETSLEAAIEIGKEGIMGFGTELLFSGIGKLFRNKAMVGTKDPITIGEREALSKKFGFDLTTGQITEGSLANQMESVFRKLPSSSGVFRKVDKKQLQRLMSLRDDLISRTDIPNEQTLQDVGIRIQENIDNLLQSMDIEKSQITNEMRDKLLKEMGSSESFYQLGRKAKDILAENSQKYHDMASELYTKAGEKIPANLEVQSNKIQETSFKYLAEELQKKPQWRDNAIIKKLSDLAGLGGISAQDIEGMVKYYLKATPEDKKALLKQMTSKEWAKKNNWEYYGGPIDVGLLKQSASFRNYSEFNAQKQAIAKAIRDEEVRVISKSGERGMAGFSTVEKRIYEDLNRAFDEDLTAFANSTGDMSIIKNINTAKNFYKGYKERFTNSTIQKLIGENPEFIAETLIKPANVTDIRLAKKALGSTGFKKVQESFTNKLVKEFKSGEQLMKTLDTYGDALNEVYAPKQIEILRNFAQGDIQLTKDTAMHPFFKRLLSDSLKNNPEMVIKTVMKPNNSQNVELLKTVLPEEQMREIQRVVLERDLLPTVEQTGYIDPRVFAKKIFQYGEEPLTALYGKEFTKDMTELAKITGLMTPASALAQRPTQVTGTLITFSSMASLGFLLKSPATAIWGTVGTLVIPYVFAKMMTNPIARKALVKGLTMKETSPEATKVLNTLKTFINNNVKKGAVLYGIQEKAPDIANITQTLSELKSGKGLPEMTAPKYNKETNWYESEIPETKR